MLNKIWDEVEFVNILETRSIEGKFLKLTEELGELAAEVIAMQGQTYKDFNREKLVEEMADTLLMVYSIFSELLKMSGSTKLDLFTSCESKMIKWKEKIKDYKVK